MKILKSLFWLAGLIMLASLLASCLPCKELSNVDPTGQFITFWYQYDGLKKEIMDEMIADFNATNEWGVTVEGVHAGDYNEIYKKIVEGIPGGQVPEISVAYQNQAAIYASMDGIVELTPYIECPPWGFGEEEFGDLGDFFPWVLIGDYLPEFDGRYGFPTQRSMEVLYYNEEWLNQLGYDHPPETWQEFEEMACAASDPEAGKEGYIFSIDASTFADSVFNRGGSIFDTEAKSYIFGDKAGLDTLIFWQELYKKGCLILESDVHEDQAEFSEGRSLFTIGSTSHLPEYKQMVSDGANFKWSISTLPTNLEKPKVNVYGASLSILRTTPEKQLAAWLFLKWLTEPEQTAKWARLTNYFPVRKSAAEGLKEYFAENPQYEKAFRFLDYDIAIEPGVRGWDECRNLIEPMMVSAVLGEDPAALLEDTQNKCNSYLEAQQAK